MHRNKHRGVPMELLSPAGNRAALAAAVSAGADAVYFGLSDFNARKMAENFTLDDLREAVDYCHLRDVRCYIAMNTLLSDARLAEALALCAEIAKRGADALIVQDIGLASALRAGGFPLEIHASTQMTLHNAQGARWAKEMGMDRVVLARETPLEAVREIAEMGVGVEFFAHGALCVSVSGQCYFSGLVGGGSRSANQGACAQPCRLPYAANRPQKGQYLLSTHDFCMISRLREMRDAGICAIKIEGRLKPPEYV